MATLDDCLQLMKSMGMFDRILVCPAESCVGIYIRTETSNQTVIRQGVPLHATAPTAEDAMAELHKLLVRAIEKQASELQDKTDKLWRAVGRTPFKVGDRVRLKGAQSGGVITDLPKIATITYSQGSDKGGTVRVALEDLEEDTSPMPTDLPFGDI